MRIRRRLRAMALACRFDNYLGSGAHLVKRWSALARSEHRLVRPDGERGARYFEEKTGYFCPTPRKGLIGGESY
jgi:hypothetical protein